MPDLKKLITLEALEAALPSWLKSLTKPSYNADEIGSTSTTNQFVTSTEKDTWNGKQNALTFDNTPTQNSDNPVKSGGIYSALAGKQASLDNTQLAAVNSGIDSTKVAQIATNQTNILSVEDMVCDNEFNTATAYVVGDIVTYEHGLYEFTAAHSAGAWTGNDVTAVNVTDMVSTKIGASDYASQNTGGTVRIWTTTVGSDTVLHISNHAAT